MRKRDIWVFVFLCVFATLAGISCKVGNQSGDAQDGDGVDVRDGRDGDDGADGWVCQLSDEDSICPIGLRPGRCGLTGRCVECNRDEECGAGRECSNEGICVDFVPCSISCPGFYDRCLPDGHCRKSCSFVWGCGRDAFCKDNLYCVRERCTPEGCCPPGWKPIEGSLECALDDCGAVGLTEGACGFEGACVECIPGLVECKRYGFRCNLQFAMCGISDGRTGGCGGTLPLTCITYSEPVDCRHNDHCVRRCTSNMDCSWSLCNWDGFCEEKSCYAGRCEPSGWVPLPWTYFCYYDPCPAQGMVTGWCGLVDQCVECMEDTQCPEGRICNLLGQCVPALCATDAECEGGRRCARGRCKTPCIYDEECGPEEVCQGAPGFCTEARCDESGWCNRWGWVPMDGSLKCRYAPCEGRSGRIRGVCGDKYHCIECIDDSDCPQDPPSYCETAGFCTSYPTCEDGQESPIGKICVLGRWYDKCEVDNDCRYGLGECRPIPDGQGGYCFYERCRRDGTCPEGWAPEFTGVELGSEGMRCIRVP